MDGFRSEVIVVGASQYNMVDHDTGRQLSGTTVRYIFGSDLKPVVDGSAKGYRLSKATLAYNDFDDRLIEVPGIYDAVVNFKVGSDGNTRVDIADLIFKRPLIQSLIESTNAKGGK